MTTAETGKLLDVWGRVNRWPEPMRLSLATRILRSLDPQTGGPGERKSLRSVIGLWDRGQPPPTDEDARRLRLTSNRKDRSCRTARCWACMRPPNCR